MSSEAEICRYWSPFRALKPQVLRREIWWNKLRCIGFFLVPKNPSKAAQVAERGWLPPREQRSFLRGWSQEVAEHPQWIHPLCHFCDATICKKPRWRQREVTIDIVEKRNEEGKRMQKTETRWWFQRFFMFTPIWGRFPFWLIVFRWVVQPPTRETSLRIQGIFLSERPERPWPWPFLDVRCVGQPFNSKSWSFCSVPEVVPVMPQCGQKGSGNLSLWKETSNTLIPPQKKWTDITWPEKKPCSKESSLPTPLFIRAHSFVFGGVIHGCKAFSLREKSTYPHPVVSLNKVLLGIPLGGRLEHLWLEAWQSTRSKGYFSLGKRWVPIHTRKSTAEVDLNSMFRSTSTAVAWTHIASRSRHVWRSMSSLRIVDITIFDLSAVSSGITTNQYKPLTRCTFFSLLALHALLYLQVVIAIHLLNLTGLFWVGWWCRIMLYRLPVWSMCTHWGMPNPWITVGKY